MRLSIRVIVGVIVSLLFIASIIALYFAIGHEYTVPLVLVAIINAEAVIFLVFLITRGIINPLGRIRSIMEKVGQGDFTVRIKVSTPREIIELGNSVNNMIGRLQDARSHEQEVEKLKTEFVSLAAHQLRAPLSQIKWTLQAILDGDMGVVTEQQREYLSKTFVSNEKMIALINDLLNTTRIEEGRYLYQPAPAQIKDTVESLVTWYQEEAKRRGIALQFEHSNEEFPKVAIDEEKIRLALQNLVDNALRYTPQGGKVTVFLKRDTQNIEISVKDTGIGIPLEQQPRLFEKFFRAENAKKTDSQGTGLGLYLTKNIIEAHGGKISFESQENKGTTFTCTIPLSTNI